MTSPAPTVDRHLTGIEDAVARLGAWARRAGADSPVPTCPRWTVRDLLAHQGMVHRWATAVVLGDDPRTVDDVGLEAEGRAADDQVGWLRTGADALLAALQAVPDDLDVMTFLAEPLPAKSFWARRQCHETSVHALDALSALEGRTLRADDVWLSDELAVDGVDELLVGFWQRHTKGPRSEKPYTAAVSATDGPVWVLEVTEHAPVTRRREEADGIPAGSRRLNGSARDVYLGLWNRGGALDDPTGLLEEWRERGAITW